MVGCNSPEYKAPPQDVTDNLLLQSVVPENPESFDGDLIRVYRAQAAKHHILSRTEERNCAKVIDTSLKRFHRAILGNNYALTECTHILQKDLEKKVNGANSTDSSVTSKEQTLGKLPKNVQLLEHLLKSNRGTFVDYLRCRTKPQDQHKHSIYQQLLFRRYKMRTLIEELSLKHETFLALRKGPLNSLGPDARVKISNY